MKVLGERVLIPLSAAIFLIGGGALWLGNTWAMVKDNALHIERGRVKQETWTAHLIEIKSELAEIRGELKRIRK